MHMSLSSQAEIDDGQLVERCLRGEDRAWEMIFRLYHPQLVSIIRYLMHGAGATEQAEEIAAAIWSSLCNDDYRRLRQYDARTGRLLFYLARIARREIWRNRRSEMKRHTRESRVARSEMSWEEADRGIVLEEFMATLTRREREFLLSDLVGSSKDRAGRSDSMANRWQLRSRVLKKLRKYLVGVRGPKEPPRAE